MKCTTVLDPKKGISELANKSLYFIYVSHDAPDVIPSKDTTILIDANADKALTTKPDANRWFRWNLLWFVLFCVVFIPLPLWLYPLTCIGGFLASCIVTVWMSLAMIQCVIHATITMVRLYRAKNKTWLQEYSKDADSLTHMVVMAGYKEPLHLMVETVDTLKAQTVAKRLFVVVALEERTPDFVDKRSQLLRRYASEFLYVMVTQHPYGIPGELPGKCSNSNYAVREAVKELKSLQLGDPERTTITLCDTDNLFPNKYFEYLGYDFLSRENRNEVVWQAPLLYNYDLDKRPFFVRVTGILRGFFMMGFLIPQNINTMSVFSMSLDLMIKGDYIHPGYQMDDIICTLHRMIALGKRIRIPLIPYPVISGPTSGSNFKQEVVEWARQARRWTIGAAEVFHYFCVKWRSFDGWSGIQYGLVFTHYYGFIICGMSLFNFTSLTSSMIFDNLKICIPANFLFSEYFAYFPLLGAVISYIVFAWAFILDKMGTKLLNIKENISPVRDFLHWLCTPLVLLAYSCIEFYAITEVAIRGKAVCKHGASKKEGLVQKF